MVEKNFAKWKKEYYKHVADKKRKYVESKKRKNVTLVSLDEEVEEIIVGDVASRVRIKLSTT
jgi:intein-encoded DNA endonuclease-like protein